MEWVLPQITKDFSAVAKCLHCLTEKGRPFAWTTECQEAFKLLKSHLINFQIRAHPDFTVPLILDTDACNQAIGVVLSQDIGGKECVIANAIRTLTKCERIYCVTRKELLALVHFVKHFKHYSYDKGFLIRNDHASVRLLFSLKTQRVT